MGENEGVFVPDQSKGDVREVVCLHQMFRWCGTAAHRREAIEIGADTHHAEIIAAQLWLKAGSNEVVTPGARPTSADSGMPLAKQEASQFRSNCMRASYLTEDRPDIFYASKETARFMSEPTMGA